MRRIYRPTAFAGFYFGALLILSIAWGVVFSQVPQNVRPWGTLFLITFGILGVPGLWANVTIDEEGIRQQFYRRHFARWEEIISWQRRGSPNSDCPDTILLATRVGSFELNGNCVYGRRLTEVESELKRRGKPAFMQN